MISVPGNLILQAPHHSLNAAYSVLCLEQFFFVQLDR